MSIAAQQLFNLLPAILRSRDLELATSSPGWLDVDDRATLADLSAAIAISPLTPAQQQQFNLLQQRSMAGPLASLLAILSEQVAALQEDLDQLYDDQFIETCADWVAPYIGDLIGYNALHGVTPAVASPRAEVAHTMAYRRRKGTTIVLEQLARDVTGWNATATEFFQKLITTQYMNHPRLQCVATPDVRQWRPLERIGTAFDSIMRSVDVRRIASSVGSGRYNLPNIGLFLWSLNAYPLTSSPAAQLALGSQCWHFHPLGIDQPLYTRPQTIDDFAQLSTPLNVPLPISRRVLNASLDPELSPRRDDYYSGADGTQKSLCLYENSSGSFQPVEASLIRVSNLGDILGGWVNLPTDGMYVVDPQLGRVATPLSLPAGTQLRVDFNYALSAELGGGEYDRSAQIDPVQPPQQFLQVPSTQYPDIQKALDALALSANGGIVEITDSGRYEEILSIDVPAQKRVELRAANGCRPTLVLDGELTLIGGEGAQIALNGFLITGDALHVTATSSGGVSNTLASLNIAHCTLVPGCTLKSDSSPTYKTSNKIAIAASLIVDIPSLAVSIERSIVGTLSIHNEATLSATDSIIDATDSTLVAYAAADGNSPGGALQLSNCTVIGKVNALSMPLVSNSILIAGLAAGDAPSDAPVVAQRRQEGCVRFSYLPSNALVPRQYQCLPDSNNPPSLSVPCFTTLRYGFAGYAQLTQASGSLLLGGADNDNQPGAFNFVAQRQRETNLNVRLGEYLRAGLEAGIFYES